MKKLFLALTLLAGNLNAHIQDGKLIPNRIKVKNSSLFLTFKVNGYDITPGTTKWFDAEQNGVLIIRFESGQAMSVPYPVRNPNGGPLQEYYIDYDVTVGAFKKIYFGKEFEVEKQIVERAVRALMEKR